MSVLWVAFLVLVALFAAAVLAKILRGSGRRRTERPWR